MNTAGGDTFKILLDCVEKGQNRYNDNQTSIFMVPSMLRDLSQGSFEPRLVSIGPLHSEHKNVQQSSGLKESYLHDLFHNFDFSDSMREQALKDCMEKVNTSINQIKASYSVMKSPVSDDELAKMMVLDGCFILEFCYKHFKNYKVCLPNMMQNVCIAIDLILVENQIPFFVLQDLFDCTLKKHVTISLTKMLYTVLAEYLHPFYYPIPETADSVPDVATDSTYDHILGLFHRRYKLPQTNPSEETKPPLQSEETETQVHSAIDLDRSGVKFMPHQNETFPMTIEFKPSLFTYFPFYWGKPTLFLPKLVIDDYSEPVFRNFIAYEQSVPRVHYHFTSYAYAMDKLVDTQEDVTRLVKSKVIVNRLGSDEEAANLINRLCRNISLVDYCYTQRFKEVHDYYSGYWPKNVARLRRTYFSSPWNAIALFAGIILFSLTVVQTVISILAIMADQRNDEDEHNRQNEEEEPIFNEDSMDISDQIRRALEKYTPVLLKRLNQTLEGR
uniref:putative UPF0481 protein At3g02645 n=1 Tax=Erigeron canadensis TaxID=72917 RepID=UPI001CB8E9A3|nr:putative UPF0481 protein At3g02645 [Erigeron canadensis]